MEVMMVAFVLLIASMLFSATSNRKVADAGRLARLEQKLDLILNHLGLEQPVPAISQPVLHWIQTGQKLQAIKAYREETGAGLADAKQAVENMEYALKSGSISAGQPAIGQPDELDQVNKTQIKRGL